MNAPRTVVVFESDHFNTTETRDYFINDDCFGDDVALFLMDRLKAAGHIVDPEHGQEDFGWYFCFTVDSVPHCFVIGSRWRDDDGREWIGWVERDRLLFRNRGISAEAVAALHEALSTPEIRGIVWHKKKDFDRGNEGQGSSES